MITYQLKNNNNKSHGLHKKHKVGIKEFREKMVRKQMSLYIGNAWENSYISKQRKVIHSIYFVVLSMSIFVSGWVLFVGFRLHE